MPCCYKLHKDIGTLHCRLSGHLNLGEIFRFIDQVLRAPGHLDGTNIVADTRAMTRLDMDTATQQQLFDCLAFLDEWDGLPRSCAVIAGGEPLWTLLGSIVSTTTLHSTVVFQRFRNPAEALAFVGLNPRVHAERFGYLPVP